MSFKTNPEPMHYHSEDRDGKCSILQRPSKDVYSQKTFKLSDIKKFIDSYAGQLDTWIGQNEFNRYNRKLINLERLVVAFSDLDTYKSIYVDMSPEEISEKLDLHCIAHNIPIPSLKVFSGRGLQVKWVFEVPKSATHLPRWKALQQAISVVLTPFGSDTNALDASRVLRLEGTVHSKSLEVVRVLEPGKPVIKYDFTYLYTKFDAHNYIDIEKPKNPPKSKMHEIAEPTPQINPFRVIEGGKSNNPKGSKLNLIAKTKQSLSWSRLLDLRTLADLRGGVQEGQRMLFLFWTLNFMAMSFQVNALSFWDEAQGVAERFFPNGDWEESALGTVFEKVCQQSRGEKIEFMGKSVTPLYTPRNLTLIRTFNITAEEQKHMLTIIDEVEKARRAKSRMEYIRRHKGMKKQENDTQIKPWVELGVSRRTYYRRKKEEKNEVSLAPLKFSSS